MSQERWRKDTGDQHEEVVVEQGPGYERREEVVHDYAAERNNALYFLTNFVWLTFGVVEGLILLRIVLRMIGANPATPFAAFVYSITDLFLWPFFGLVAEPQVNNFVLEISSIIAMIVYALIAWVIVRLLWMLLGGSPTRRVSTYERDRDNF